MVEPSTSPSAPVERPAVGGTPPAMWGAAFGLVLIGLTVFLLAVALSDVHVRRAGDLGRAGYCSVKGNTAADGTPLQPGTFLDLLIGEPDTNGHFTGADPANFVKGVGLTCAAPPAGYVRQGVASGAGIPGTGVYPYFVPAGQ